MDAAITQVVVFLLGAGAVFAFIWAVAIMASRRSFHDSAGLALMIALAGVWQAAGAYAFSGLYKTFPQFMGWHNPLLFLLGPVVYRFFQNGLLHRRLPSLAMAVHSIPAVVCALALIPYWWGTGAERIARASGSVVDGYTYVLLACNVGPKLSILAYLSFIAFQFVKSLAHSSDKSVRRLLFGKLLVIYVSLAGGSLGYFLENRTLVVLSAGSLPLIIFSFFVLSEAVPGVFSDLGREVRKYERTRLTNVAVDSVYKRLDTVMRIEKAYTDEDLTLPKLALEVELTAHQLSEFLNRHLGRTFSDYVNEFRVREAQILLASEPERTTLSIAHAAGFNSKSSFYRVFRRAVGMDPSEFRAGAVSHSITRDQSPGLKL